MRHAAGHLYHVGSETHQRCLVGGSGLSSFYMLPVDILRRRFVYGQEGKNFGGGDGGKATLWNGMVSFDTWR